MTTQLVERAYIFNAAREMLGRGFTPEEVRRMDKAIDAAVGIAGTSTPTDTIGPAGLAIIMEFEGCAKRRADGDLQAYPDPGTGGKPWTIGWGSTTDEAGNPIAPGAVWTQERCDRRLASHVAEFAAQVRAALGGSKVTSSQFDALVSLAYNIGIRALEGSTLLRKHKEGEYSVAAAEFGKWVKAGGKTLPGLVRRRAAEAALYRRAS